MLCNVIRFCHTGNYSCIPQEKLKKLLQKVLRAYDSGVIAGNESSASNWDYRSSVFFSTTVVTTIGKYHHWEQWSLL